MLGNFIGIDGSGLVGLGNGSWGVRIEGVNNVLGGTAVGARNLISWNRDGVLISAGVSNLVQGNLIGSDVSGTNALGNGSGVLILNSAYNLIGGTNAAARNGGRGRRYREDGPASTFHPPLNFRSYARALSAQYVLLCR